MEKMQDMQEIQNEGEKKSYGKKRKSPLGIFLTMLPLILATIAVFFVYRYGRQIIAERDNHNKALIHEAAASSTGVEREGAVFEKLKKGEDLHILLLGDEGLRADSIFLSKIKDLLEKEYSGKIVYEEAKLPNNATALSGYLYLQTQEPGEKGNQKPDLVFFLFGEHDEIFTFPYYYELLLRTLMEKYPDAGILPIISYKALLPEGQSRVNATALENIVKHYSLESLNLAAVVAKQEENPENVLGNQELFQAFQEKYFVSSILSAMQTLKPGEMVAPINPILEEVRECIAIPASLWSDYGNTALLLAEEELDKLSLKGRHGIFALSTALHGGENKGNLYVDGILEGKYSLTGDSYLGVLSRDVKIRRQLILNFETEEEKNNFQSLYYISPIPLEKGLTNGIALTLPEVESSPAEIAEGNSEGESSTDANPESKTEKSDAESVSEKNGTVASGTENKASSDSKTSEKSGEGLVESSEEIIGIYDDAPN